MSLNQSKKESLIQLINCEEKWTVKEVTDLSDGKLFCDIIQEVFPETFELLKVEGNINVIEEELSKDEGFHSNFDFQSENLKMIVDDAESENAVNKDLEAVQKSDTELTKSAVLPTNSFGEFVPEQVDSAAGDKKTVKKSRKKSKPVVSDGESAFKSVESTENNSESLAKSFKSSEKDRKLISNRYRLIQYFIDVRYNLRSETVITFSECWEDNELELAKVLIFIMSEVVRHCVQSHNSTLIQTLSHVENPVQQDLEQCFNFFINERNKITREEIEKILISHAPHRISGSPNNGYFSTPRRCSSRFRRSSQSTTKSQESVFTDSPLKTYFESPIFTKADIVSKEKEILKIRQILFDEESNSLSLLQKVVDLEKKLVEKDKEINDFKMKNRMLQEMEKSEDCENCIRHEKTIEDIKRQVIELEGAIQKNKTDLEEQYQDQFLGYQIEVAETISEFGYENRKANERINITRELYYEAKEEKERSAEIMKHLREELYEKIKELEVYKEKLSYADRSIKEEAQSPVFGECMGGYFKEEKEKSQSDTSQTKLTMHPEEKSVKHVMVQVAERNFFTEYQEKSDVLMPELPVSNTLPDCENIHNLKKCPENANKMVSDVCDASNKLDTTSKQFNNSAIIEACLVDNSIPSVTNNGIGSLWHQYNSFSENENRNNNYPSITNDGTSSLSYQYNTSFSENQNNNYPSITNDGIGTIWHQNNNFISKNENSNGISCTDNVFTKALSILQKTESDLNQMTKHLLALSKVSPNGSNGLVGSPFREFLEELKKSVQKAVLCLSQTGGSQIKFQNNNSISKNMIDEAGGNSDGAVFSKCFECSKAGTDLPNSKTIVQDNSALLKKTQEINCLKDKCKAALKSFNLKEKELEHYKKKYSYLKHGHQESLKNTKELELKCQKLEIEIKEARNREIDFKKESKRERNFLKMQIKEMGEKWHKLQSCVLSLKMEVNDTNEENKALQNEISVQRHQNEKLLSHIKSLEKFTKESSRDVNPSASTSSTTKENKDVEGIKDEDTLLENTCDDSQKPDVSEVASQDSNNESTISGALHRKSFHSGLHLHNDDEEGFLNHSSLLAIQSGHESPGPQDITRFYELYRRNSLLPKHLQSHYAIEALPVTPIEHLKEKMLKGLKPEQHPENVVRIGKKRKVSEMESHNQPSQLLATPVAKIKRKFLQTPTSLKKWRFYRRNQRSGYIKPKP